MGIINVRGVSYKCCMFDMTEEDVVKIHNHLESELRLDNFIRLDNKNVDLLKHCSQGIDKTDKTNKSK